MKSLILILLFFLINSCGKGIEEGLYEGLTVKNIPTALSSSRLIEENHKPIPALNLDSSKIMEKSDFVLHSTLKPPSEEYNLVDLINVGKYLYIAYYNNLTKKTMIDVLDATNPENIKITTSFEIIGKKILKLESKEKELYALYINNITKEYFVSKIIFSDLDKMDFNYMYSSFNEIKDFNFSLNKLNISTKFYIKSYNILENELRFDSMIEIPDVRKIERSVLFDYIDKSEEEKMIMSRSENELLSWLEIPRKNNKNNVLFGENNKSNDLIKDKSIQKRKNSLKYIFNNINNEVEIADLSTILESENIIRSHSSNILENEINSLDQEQQRLIVSQEEKGFVFINAENPSNINNKHLLLFNKENKNANFIKYLKVNGHLLVVMNDEGNGLKLSRLAHRYERSSEIKFYAKGLVGQLSSKMVLRINGEVVMIQDIFNDEYRMYSFNHHRAIRKEDRVELILPSNNGTQNKIFASFLLVNNTYCYQEIDNIKDDIALMSPNQTIEYYNGECNTTIAEPMCGIGELKMPYENCSLGNNLIGTFFCDDTGYDFVCEDSGICENGFFYENGLCLEQTCTPLSYNYCFILNGEGEQQCLSNGIDRGSCEAISCNLGYHIENNQCISDKRSCIIDNGVGEETWNGFFYENCSLISCDFGFYENGNYCTPQICAPSTTSSCNINNGDGVITCNNEGSEESSCQIISCDIGYHLENGACISNTRECSVNNGTGTQSWNGDGYDSCSLTLCNVGYYEENGSCLPQSCTPETTISCFVENGVGTQTCNSLGHSYSLCEAISCNSGYHIENNLCYSNTRNCSIENGTGTQSWISEDEEYGVCQVESCSNDAYQSGNTCQLYCPDPLLVHVILLGVHVCL